MDFYKNRLNWEVFLERAKIYSLNIPIYYVFNYARQFFNADIPTFVTDRLKPTKKEALKAKIVQRLLRKSYTPNLFRFIYLLVLPSMTEKIYILGRALFPSREFLKRRYGISSHESLLFCYLKRPFFGLVKGIRIVRGMLNLEGNKKLYFFSISSMKLCP